MFNQLDYYKQLIEPSARSTSHLDNEVKVLRLQRSKTVSANNVKQSVPPANAVRLVHGVTCNANPTSSHHIIPDLPVATRGSLGRFCGNSWNRSGKKRTEATGVVGQNLHEILSSSVTNEKTYNCATSKHIKNMSKTLSKESLKKPVDPGSEYIEKNKKDNIPRFVSRSTAASCENNQLQKNSAPKNLMDGWKPVNEAFQGKELVQWICRQSVIAGQRWSCELVRTVVNVCTCLLNLGLLQLTSKTELTVHGTKQHTDAEGVHPRIDRLNAPVDDLLQLCCNQTDENSREFQMKRYYKWTAHSCLVCTNGLRPEGTSVNTGQQQSCDNVQINIELDNVRRYYEEELVRLRREHELNLFQVKNQNVMKMCQLVGRIEVLEREIEKYRVLAGIELLTRSPRLDELRNCSLNVGLSRVRSLSHHSRKVNNKTNYSPREENSASTTENEKSKTAHTNKEGSVTNSISEFPT